MDTPENKSVQDTLEIVPYFVTNLYGIQKPEFIESVLPVFDEYVAIQAKQQEPREIYPSVMTADFGQDLRIRDFAMYILNTSFNIMVSQGINMDGKMAVFQSLWGQEHEKYSLMEQHTHGEEGVQLVGFYFLDTPEKCSVARLHDPRPGKNQSTLRLKDTTQLSYSSDAVALQPKPGTLLFTNAWLPHSFSQNGSETPLKFIHFNIAIKDAPQQPVVQTQPAEVV